MVDISSACALDGFGRWKEEEGSREERVFSAERVKTGGLLMPFYSATNFLFVDCQLVQLHRNSIYDRRYIHPEPYIVETRPDNTLTYVYSEHQNY